MIADVFNLGALAGVPVRVSTVLEDGKVWAIGADGVTSTVIVGVRPDDHPAVIARKIVREGLRDVLAWLDHPPSMLTGREVLDLLAGRPVWKPTNIRGLHCPACGSTNPCAWRQAFGSPEVWCACAAADDDDGGRGTDIVDGCDDGCVHG